jgi:hypothetical protein
MIVKGIIPQLNISKNVCIVGSSSNVLKKDYAKLIDSFDEVIRFNRAPTKGYENEVGSKCTLRIVNHHTFVNARPDYKRFTKKGNPQDFVKKLRGQNVIVGNGNAKGRWENRHKHLHSSCDGYFIHGSVYHRLKKNWQIKRQCSIGLIGIWVCIINGIVPHVFGFGVGEGDATHYWEKRSPKTPCHNFSREREVLTAWASGKYKNRKIILHT